MTPEQLAALFSAPEIEAREWTPPLRHSCSSHGHGVHGKEAGGQLGGQEGGSNSGREAWGVAGWEVEGLDIHFLTNGGCDRQEGRGRGRV